MCENGSAVSPAVTEWTTPRRQMFRRRGAVGSPRSLLRHVGRRSRRRRRGGHRCHWCGHHRSTPDRAGGVRHRAGVAVPRTVEPRPQPVQKAAAVARVVATGGEPGEDRRAAARDGGRSRSAARGGSGGTRRRTRRVTPRLATGGEPGAEPGEQPHPLARRGAGWRTGGRGGTPAAAGGHSGDRRGRDRRGGSHGNRVGPGHHEEKDGSVHAIDLLGSGCRNRGWNEADCRLPRLGCFGNGRSVRSYRGDIGRGGATG